MSVLARVRATTVRRRHLLPLALALLGLALLVVPLAPQREAGAQTPLPALPAATAGQPDLDTGRIIVRFAPGVSRVQRAALHSLFAATVIDSIPALTIEVVRIANPSATQAVAAAYDRNPLVVYAEPDALMPFADAPVTPNDQFYNPALYQWQHAAIDSPQAWGVTTGNSALRVTICDTGVSATHPDLIQNLRADLGKNVVDGSDNWTPIHWHGTFVAGMAAAVGNNTIGVAGAAWTAEIIPVRISNVASGGAFISDMAKCIEYGANLGSTAINLSYVTYTVQGGGVISLTILAAADYANNLGSVLVVAAGNNNRNIIKQGEIDPENILYVASTDEGDTKSSFSNFGPYVDLAAPGGSVASTAVCVELVLNPACDPNENLYIFSSGTSFSSPLTAGVALLVYAQNAAVLDAMDPPDRAAAIRAALTGGACDLGAAGEDNIFGAGLLNAHHAVHIESCDAVAITITPSSLDFGVVDLGATVSTPADGATLTVANTGTSGVVLSVEYLTPFADCGTDPEDWAAVAAGEGPGPDQFAMSVSLGGGSFVGVPLANDAALGSLTVAQGSADLDIEFEMPSSTSFFDPCTTNIVITAFAS